MTHPTAEALELYVIGAHEDLAVAELETHLRACNECTAEVRRQAQLDKALAEVAAEALFCPGCDVVLTGPRCKDCGAAARAGDYRMERVIVQNPHGRMYLARDPHGHAVALKELAFVQPPHPDAVAAFEREVRLLRQLSHPQIPRFVASFREGQGVDTRLYLAQEYVEGESLLTRLSRHQFSEEEAREVALQVLATLVYLQNLAPMVFHRDIKPGNLIRRPDGRIALVDFGAARDLGSTVGATLVGTFGYMPVEQLGGIVDATTDLHALGATLFHLLSRREPWRFVEDPRAFDRLNVSHGFRQFIRKLTARRPDDRFPSALAAQRALLARSSRRRVGPGLRWAIPAVAFAASFTAGALVGSKQQPEPRPSLTHVNTRYVTDDLDLDVQITDDAFSVRRLDGDRRPLAGLWTRASATKVRVCLDDQGKVTSVTSLEDTPDEARIIEVVSHNRFVPAERDGRPVPSCREIMYVVRPR